MALEYVFKLQEFHPNACKIGENGICGFCSKISLLNTDIQRLQRALKILVDERRSLLDGYANQMHSAIYRIPPELLIRIFTLYAEDEHDSYLKAEYNSQANKPNLYPKGYTRPSRATSLTLSAVCKRWREVSFATPMLWTAPVVTIKPRPSRIQDELLTEWLDRSCNLPLDVSVFCLYKTDTSAINLIGRIIVQQAPRLARLDLNLPPNRCQDILNRLEGAQGLEELRLHPVETSEEYCRNRTLSLPVLPALRTLWINHAVNFNKTEFPALVTCDLGRLDMKDIVEILVHAPNLEQCAFSNVRCIHDQASPLRHAHLRKLDISSPTVDFMTVLLGILTLPSLQSIKFSVFNSQERSTTEPFENVFASFLYRSQCLLQEVELSGNSKDLSQETLMRRSAGQK
ncbi:hypothetical protein CVT26_013066 [Gymnopilus dilepis]|uniref:Uncharacterized protein n=1 Tax=Gymnopilus dilepis TaxID=231916 RepID=A0A409Y4F9_9AGAR|nr:hypothetical protein CVT26_013066 [Gymnopilus dilepis]